MAKLFKNRSDNDIKNKWYSMMRKQKRISDQLLNEFAPMATPLTDTPVMTTQSSSSDSKPRPSRGQWGPPKRTYPLKSGGTPGSDMAQKFTSE
jgi:hypothetical protein